MASLASHFAACSSSLLDGKVLKVIIARKHSWHGRSLLNGHELAKACSKSSVSDHSGVPWALSCQLIGLGSLPLRKVVSTMRSADVLVSMHGADVINGLHLPPGRAVIEIVNHNFDKSQTWRPFGLCRALNGRWRGSINTSGSSSSRCCVASRARDARGTSMQRCRFHCCCER